MKIKLLISLFLCLISLPVFAQGTQSFAIKTDGHITASQENLITNAFRYLNKGWSDKGKSLSQNTTEKYFTPDTSLIINGKNVYTGYAQLAAHFQQVSQFIRGNIRFPLLEVMSIDNKLIVYFNEDIYDNNGVSYPATTMAIFTIDNGRIQQWEEVAYTKYFAQAESANAVYANKLKT